MNILVTGATGTVGSALVRALTARGVVPHVLVRSEARLAGSVLADSVLAGPARSSAASRSGSSGADRAGSSRAVPDGPGVRTGDYRDPASLATAFRSIDRVFLLSANHPEQVAWETAAIDAAAAAGVRQIVKMSALGARIGSPVAFTDAHARIEAHLSAAGIPWVSLRPAFLMSNLLAAAPAVRQTGALFLPAAGAKVAMIDPRDVAAVAATVLTGDGHDGRTYELTGPEAIAFDEVAEQLSTVLSRRIAFVPVPDGDALGQLVASGVPEWYASNVVTQFGQLRQGAQDRAGDAVQVLTGREPRPIGAFLRDHAAAFA